MHALLSFFFYRYGGSFFEAPRGFERLFMYTHMGTFYVSYIYRRVLSKHEEDLRRFMKPSGQHMHMHTFWIFPPDVE